MSEVFLILLQRTGKTFTGSWLLLRGADLAPVPNVEAWPEFQPLWKIESLSLQGTCLASYSCGHRVSTHTHFSISVTWSASFLLLSLCFAFLNSRCIMQYFCVFWEGESLHAWVHLPSRPGISSASLSAASKLHMGCAPNIYSLS